MPTPESLARETIDQKLTAAGWIVQDFTAPHIFSRICILRMIIKNQAPGSNICAVRCKGAQPGGGTGRGGIEVRV
jgi:hypothetical protein